MPDMKQFYDAYWASREATGYVGNFASRERAKAVVRQVQSADPRPKTVCDVGCGEGCIGQLLRAELDPPPYLVGLDISVRATEMAAPHYDEVHSVDLESDDIGAVMGAKRFDTVICLETLEHVWDSPAVLKRLSELGTDDATFLLSFPNFAFWRNRVKCLRGKFPEEEIHIFADTDELHYFTLETFSDMLEQCGLEGEVVDGVFWTPMSQRIPYSLQKAVGRRVPTFFGEQMILRCHRR